MRSVGFHGFCCTRKKYFNSQRSAKNELEPLPFVRVAFHFSLWSRIEMPQFLEVEGVGMVELEKQLGGACTIMFFGLIFI